MKSKSLTIVALLAALLAIGAPLITSTTHAADDAKKEKKAQKKGRKAKSAVQGYYAIIAKAVDLSDEQKKAFEDAIKARKEALGKWDTDNKAAVDALKEQAGKARKDGNKDAAKQIGTKLKKLTAARTAIDNQTKKRCLPYLMTSRRPRCPATTCMSQPCASSTRSA